MHVRGITAAERSKQVQIDQLQEQVRQLREALAPSTVLIPREWKLSTSEARVFAHLTTREIVSQESMLTALYSGRAGEYPDLNMTRVLVAKIRRKVAPYGVRIVTIWGQGYALVDRQQFMAKGEAA